MIEINLEEIKKLIPHRNPFLFIEKCSIIELEKEGIGYKKFHPSEYFFEGHFPDMPIVPGVIIVEALAQTAGIVVSKKYEHHENKSVLFMSVSKAKFRKPVLPNDSIQFHVNCINRVRNVYKFKGEAFNSFGNIKVCDAEFSAMISSN
jgi:3-hydroxyacyl-[acyl-carrier-protein] dehydratase